MACRVTRTFLVHQNMQGIAYRKNTLPADSDKGRLGTAGQTEDGVYRYQELVVALRGCVSATFRD